MFQLANTIMKLKAGFIGSTEFWENWGYKPEEAVTMDQKFGWVETIYTTIMTVLIPILAIVAAAGIVWAIVLGVQMARADSTDKREEAKKRLIGLIVGIVILVVLIVFFTTLFPVIIKAFVTPPAAE